MYDLDDDETISKDELLNILHMMVGANISQDQLLSIAEVFLIFTEFGVDLRSTGGDLGRLESILVDWRALVNRRRKNPHQKF